MSSTGCLTLFAQTDCFEYPITVSELTSDVHDGDVEEAIEMALRDNDAGALKTLIVAAAQQWTDDDQSRYSRIRVVMIAGKLYIEVTWSEHTISLDTADLDVNLAQVKIEVGKNLLITLHAVKDSVQKDGNVIGPLIGLLDNAKKFLGTKWTGPQDWPASPFPSHGAAVEVVEQIFLNHSHYLKWDGDKDNSADGPTHSDDDNGSPAPTPHGSSDDDDSESEDDNGGPAPTPQGSSDDDSGAVAASLSLSLSGTDYDDDSESGDDNGGPAPTPQGSSDDDSGAVAESLPLSLFGTDYDDDSESDDDNGGPAPTPQGSSGSVLPSCADNAPGHLANTVMNAVCASVNLKLADRKSQQEAARIGLDEPAQRVFELFLGPEKEAGEAVSLALLYDRLQRLVQALLNEGCSGEDVANVACHFASTYRLLPYEIKNAFEAVLSLPTIAADESLTRIVCDANEFMQSGSISPKRGGSQNGKRPAKKARLDGGK
jgi:hypothetical protein